MIVIEVHMGDGSWEPVRGRPYDEDPQDLELACVELQSRRRNKPDATYRMARYVRVGAIQPKQEKRCVKQ